MLGECLATWESLPPAAREAIRLVGLPMDDVVANAHLVNAVQRHASVVVQKSLQEGFGLTVTEAMWKSRPVVASAVGGIIGQVPPGTGILIDDPSDLDAFGCAVAALLARPAEMAAMGRRAHRHVRAHYLSDRHLIDYARLLEHVTGGLRPVPSLGAVASWVMTPPGHLVGMDADERVARAAGPRLESETGERDDLLGVVHAPRLPGHQHAPALAHRLVDSVDLEADPLLAPRAASAWATVVLTITSPSLTAKLTGCATGPRGDRNTTLPTPPARTCASHWAAVSSRSSGCRPAGPVPAAGRPGPVEVLGRALERDGQEQDGAGAQVAPPRSPRSSGGSRDRPPPSPPPPRCSGRSSVRRRVIRRARSPGCASGRRRLRSVRVGSPPYSRPDCGHGSTTPQTSSHGRAEGHGARRVALGDETDDAIVLDHRQPVPVVPAHDGHGLLDRDVDVERQRPGGLARTPPG